MSLRDITILFDESGTPTIKKNNRTNWFLGVSVQYDQSTENMIFSKCAEKFGLCNSRPLKNDKIKPGRAIRIAELLMELPIFISVSGIDITNLEYRKLVVDYAKFDNYMRKKHRKMKGRSVAQIMHTRVLSNCLFNSIAGYFEAGGDDATFSIFIDDWSIPEEDIYLYLDYKSQMLKHFTSLLCKRFHKGQPDSVDGLKLMTVDSDRKRFIDVITSVISRAFLILNDSKYSHRPLNILKETGRACFVDETKHSIRIMYGMMNDERIL